MVSTALRSVSDQSSLLWVTAVVPSRRSASALSITTLLTARTPGAACPAAPRVRLYHHQRGSPASPPGGTEFTPSSPARPAGAARTRELGGGSDDQRPGPGRGRHPSGRGP